MIYYVMYYKYMFEFFHIFEKVKHQIFRDGVCSKH
jgi:hypothetical protein